MASASNAPIRFKLPNRADVFLHHLHGVEEIGKPFRYELTILSPDGALSKADFLGQPMSVELDVPEIPGLRKAGHRYFHGYVTRFARQGRHRSHYVYGVSLRPWVWLLSRAKNCRIFQNKSVLEIVKDVFDKHGLKEIEDRLIEKYPKREYVVQYRESDLDFVTRLMSEVGIFYFHRHEAGRHVLVLADSTNSHPAGDTVWRSSVGRLRFQASQGRAWGITNSAQRARERPFRGVRVPWTAHRAERRGSTGAASA